MPRITKANYENAIKRHAAAKANRAKLPKTILLSKLKQITNKYNIGVVPRRAGNANVAKHARPLISERKKINAAQAIKTREASKRLAPKFRQNMALKKQAKSEQLQRQNNLKEANKLLTEIVNQIVVNNVNNIMYNLFNNTPNNKVQGKKASPKLNPKHKATVAKKKPSPKLSPKHKATVAKKKPCPFAKRKKATKQSAKVKAVLATMQNNGVFGMKSKPVKKAPVAKKKKMVAAKNRKLSSAKLKPKKKSPPLVVKKTDMNVLNNQRKAYAAKQNANKRKKESNAYKAAVAKLKKKKNSPLRTNKRYSWETWGNFENRVNPQ